MKYIFCASLLLYLVNGAAQNMSIADKRLNTLDTAFQRVLKTWNAPGFAVAVVEKNKIIYVRGFGYRDYEKKLPVTPNTLFAIGSCTKAFTTSLIGLLQKEGKLDIDQPAHLYLPALQFYSADLTNNITLRDMMSHRTGLPRHDLSWYLFNTGNRDSLLYRIQYQEPTFPIRRQWQYNNFMYVAQGAVIEKLTGKSWEENIREKILQPLQMKSSVLSIPEMKSSADAAVGYGLKKDSLINPLPYYEINAAGPAGSINSNVMDMANWLLTWINGGQFNGKEILPLTFMKEAISSQSIVSGGLPAEKTDIHFSNYGFGWMLASYKGHYRVDHGGNIDGFSATTCFFPTDSIGIVVLSNQNGSSVPSIIRNLIADKLLGKPYFNWNDDVYTGFIKGRKLANEANKSKTSMQKTGTRPSHPLNDYEGFYTHQGYGSFDVSVQNDSLFARVPGRKLFLQHFHYDVFLPYLIENNTIDTSEINPYRIEFNTDISGEIESLDAVGFEAPTIQLTFKRSAKTKAMSQSELAVFEGIFIIAGTEIRVYATGNSLRMLVPGQPEYELVPTGNEKFAVKNLNGYSVQFLRDSQNMIHAMNLIQPNGTFKAEKKK